MELTLERFVASENNYYLKIGGTVIGIVEVNRTKSTLEIKFVGGWGLKL